MCNHVRRPCACLSIIASPAEGALTVFEVARSNVSNQLTLDLERSVAAAFLPAQSKTLSMRVTTHWASRADTSAAVLDKEHELGVELEFADQAVAHSHGELKVPVPAVQVLLESAEKQHGCVASRHYAVAEAGRFTEALKGPPRRPRWQQAKHCWPRPRGLLLCAL